MLHSETLCGVYVETLLLGCINIIFDINEVVFQILSTTIRLFL